MEHNPIPEKARENWLTMAVILILGLIAFSAALLFSYHANGTFHPWKWGPKTIYYMTIASAILLSILLWYWDEVDFYKFPSVIFDSFDINEYTTDKRWLDVLISHYSNVATVGLFFGVGIYTFRNSSFFSDSCVAIIMALICCAGFLIYSLLLLRLAKRFLSHRSVIAYVGICLIALFLDTTALGMIIKSVPAA